MFCGRPGEALVCSGAGYGERLPVKRAVFLFARPPEKGSWLCFNGLANKPFPGTGQRTPKLLGWVFVCPEMGESGCPCHGMGCYSAGRQGHLAVLKWARENGCPCNSWRCITAVAGDHPSVVEWASDNGCPLDERPRSTATGPGARRAANARWFAVLKRKRDTWYRCNEAAPISAVTHGQ